jgi:MFS transporter, DHA3 family, macrolide efflux protein
VGSIPSSGFFCAQAHTRASVCAGCTHNGFSVSHFSKVLKNRNFFLLWVGQIISQLGDRLSQMALIGLVYQRAPGSAMQIAKILSFTIIPVFLIGPVAGAYVDRWDRRKTMYACDLLRALLVVLIPLLLLGPPVRFIYIYLIIFLAFSIGRFFVPAKMAIVPELVDKKFLVTANSLINTTGMIAAVLGFGISGVIVEKLGPKSGFYLDSVSFLVSAICIFLIASRSHGSTVNLKELGFEIVKDIKKSIFIDIKEGILYFIKHAEIRFTAGIIFFLWSCLGAVYVVSIVFVQSTLHSATKDLGFLIVFLGLGLFAGSVVYGSLGHKLSQFKIIFASLVTSGITLAIFALVLNAYPYFPCAAALTLLLGVTISPVMIASNTIIHKASDNHMMGKTFSSLEIVIHLGFLIFMFASGFLAERFPQAAILVCTGLLIAAAGVISLFYRREL